MAASLRPSARALLGPFALLVAILGLIPTPTRATALSDAAEWLSDETLLYVEVLQPESLVDLLQGLELRKTLGQLPNVAKALDNKQFREFRDLVGHVARAQGKTGEQLLRDLTAGGFVVAAEKPDQIVLLVEPRTPDTLEHAHETLIDLVRQDARAKGNKDPYTTFTHRDATVYQLGPKEAHALVGGKLVLASHRDLVTRVIDRMKGEPGRSPSLAGNSEWSARRKAFTDDAGAFVFARFDTFRKLDPNFLKTKPEDEAGTLFLLGAWFDAIRKASVATATLTWSERRLAAEVDLSVPADQISDALKRFRPAAGQGAAPLLEPPGTLLSMSLWRDFSAIWDVRDQVLPAEALPGLAQFDTFAGQFFGGRDFGTGVLGALGSNWRLVVVQQDYERMDPAPDTKLPGFALVLDLNPEDDQFAVRLQAAFQSFVGLANLDAAQKKNPPLLLGTESVDGVTFTKATYLAPTSHKSGEPYETRFNISPCAAQVDNTFILSSSVDVTRSLIRALKAGPASGKPTSATLEARADGLEVAKLVDLNRESLVMRNMLEKGNDKTTAESEIDLLSKLLRIAGKAALQINDRTDGVTARLSLELNPK